MPVKGPFLLLDHDGCCLRQKEPAGCTNQQLAGLCIWAVGMQVMPVRMQ
jgi:hypothetical protein